MFLISCFHNMYSDLQHDTLWFILAVCTRREHPLSINLVFLPSLQFSYFPASVFTESSALGIGLLSKLLAVK